MYMWKKSDRPAKNFDFSVWGLMPPPWASARLTMFKFCGELQHLGTSSTQFSDPVVSSSLVWEVKIGSGPRPPSGSSPSFSCPPLSTSRCCRTTLATLKCLPHLQSQPAGCSCSRVLFRRSTAEGDPIRATSCAQEPFSPKAETLPHCVFHLNTFCLCDSFRSIFFSLFSPKITFWFLVLWKKLSKQIRSIFNSQYKPSSLTMGCTSLLQPLRSISLCKSWLAGEKYLSASGRPTYHKCHLRTVSPHSK